MIACFRPETEELDERSPFKQGFDACFSAAYASLNPFEEGSYDFDEWQFGWAEAERRCALAAEAESGSGYSLAD